MPRAVPAMKSLVVVQYELRDVGLKDLFGSGFEDEIRCPRHPYGFDFCDAQRSRATGAVPCPCRVWLDRELRETEATRSVAGE